MRNYRNCHHNVHICLSCCDVIILERFVISWFREFVITDSPITSFTNVTAKQCLKREVLVWFSDLVYTYKWVLVPGRPLVSASSIDLRSPIAVPLSWDSLHTQLYPVDERFPKAIYQQEIENKNVCISFIWWQLVMFCNVLKMESQII